MKVLDRYIAREMAMPFLVGLFIFGILLIFQILFDYMSVFIAKGVSLLTVLKLLLFAAPGKMVTGMPMGAIPLSTLLASSLAINRMARDSEITALRCASISLKRIFRPILTAAAIISVACFLLNEHVVPRSERKLRRMMEEINYSSSLPFIQSNVFFHADDYWFYIQRVDRSNRQQAVLYGVMVYQLPRAAGEYPLLMTARTARYQKNLWTLSDIVRYTFRPDGTMARQDHARSAYINLRHSPPNFDFLAGARLPREMTMKELRSQMDLFGRASGADRGWEVEYFFKTSIPFSCFILALCCAPLSLYFSRSGFAGILLSIILAWIYFNAMLIAKAFGMSGMLLPSLAAWGPNIFFAFTGAYLLWRGE
ncbi:MAG: LptF/LptG family permease [Armatimonadetes bacterium]|nr:LptF/LptG family permease [Armatimonadota bacterium]